MERQPSRSSTPFGIEKNMGSARQLPTRTTSTQANTSQPAGEIAPVVEEATGQTETSTTPQVNSSSPVVLSV